MKKLAVAALAMLAGACATTDTRSGNGSAARAASAAGTQYCWQERLDSASGTLTCNWSGSFRDACDSTQLTSLQASRYSAPARTRMCNNGQWLVEVSPRG
jgi:hypothetical protein